MSSNACARRRGPTELRWKDTRRESADDYGCLNFTDRNGAAEEISLKVGVFSLLPTFFF